MQAYGTSLKRSLNERRRVGRDRRDGTCTTQVASIVRSCMPSAYAVPSGEPTSPAISLLSCYIAVGHFPRKAPRLQLAVTRPLHA